MNTTKYCDDYERNVVPNLYGYVASDTYRNICLALLIVTCLYFIIGLILFLRYKNTQIRLQSRSTFVTVCLVFSFIGLSFAVFLREYFGRDKSHCGSYALALYLSFVFSGGTYDGNLYSYIYKLRIQRDQGFQLMKQQKTQQQEGDAANSRQNSQKKGCTYYYFDFTSMLKYSKDGRIYFPGYDEKEDNASAQESESTGAFTLNFLFNDDQDDHFKWTWRDRINEAIIYPIIILYMFGSIMFIIMGVRILAHPLYINDCRGCQLEDTDYIIFAANSAVNIFWIVIAVYGIRNEADPLGVVSDAKFGVFCFILTMPICILQIYDPNNYYRDYKFTWDILFCFISCIMFFPVIYGPLIKSYWERSKSRIQPTSTHLSQELIPRVSSDPSKFHTKYSSTNLPPSSALNVNLIIQEPRARNALLEHMINELSSENLVFVFKVRAWKDIWSKDSVEKVNRIAINLYNEYILRSGKTQINIPNAVYSKIEKTMSSYLDSSKQRSGNVSPKEVDKIPITAFDGCEAECLQIIRTDSLPRFRLSALFKERIIETGILDKVLNKAKLEEIQIES